MSFRSLVRKAVPHEDAGAERFDMGRIAEYDAYARKSAHATLAKHDAWLKRREINGPVRGKGRVGYVGVGIFGFKAR
jgi:hypothetical protein